MATPSWFESQVYFQNKLEQLGPDWDAAKLEAALKDAGYSMDADGLYKHFQDWGNAERISPNNLFNVAEYLQAKAEQLNAEGGDKVWDPASVLAAIEAAGLTVWDHYTQYGMYEGVNPSNQFDTDAYFAAKLAELQANEPEKNWTKDSMLDAFKEAGLNPLEHYSLYGKEEGLTVPPVPADQQVSTDFDPYRPSVPGETFNLTTAVETITGTANDDVINGVASGVNAQRTLNPEDSIDGAAGYDTLNVDMQGNFSGFTTGSMKHVEKVVLTNTDSVAHTFSAKGVEGVETYSLNAKGAAVNLSDLNAAGVAVNIHGLQSGATSIGFTADAVKGEADALTLGLYGVGAAAQGSTAAKYVNMNVAGIENLSVKAVDDNYVNLSQVAAAKSVTVSGTGHLNVEKVAGSVTSLDASAMTGNLTADLSAATLDTLKGGSGDDTLTVAALKAGAVLDGGAGNDTLILKGANGALQPTMSGFENITVDGGALTLSGKNVTDLTALTVKNGASVTLADMGASDFSATASGATAGNVTLADAVAFTYNTQAADAAKQTKDTVSTAVTAAKATSATVNVGAYTDVTGTLNFASAKDVTVNVASGLGSGDTEQTSFGGTINANKAEMLTVNAEGNLAASTFTVNGAASVNIAADKGSTGAVNVQAAAATEVSIAAGADMGIQGSNFAAAQNVTLTQNAGLLDGAGVALKAVNQLTVSGAGGVTLGDLGSSTQTYGLTVDAGGLNGAFTADAVNAGNNDVTIRASSLGTTKVGDIIGNNVTIDALGLLGGSKADAALETGDIDAFTNNSGNLAIHFDGSSDVEIGNLGGTKAFDSITLDAADYLGAQVGITADATKAEAIIGTLTANTVTIDGSALATNTFTGSATVAANALTFNGGLGADAVDLTARSGDTLTAVLNTGAGDDRAIITGTTSTTAITLSGNMGGDEGDMVVVDAASSTAAATINLSGLEGYASSVIKASANSTVTGGAGSDAVSITSGTKATLVGGDGADYLRGGNVMFAGAESKLVNGVYQESASTSSLGFNQAVADVFNGDKVNAKWLSAEAFALFRDHNVLDSGGVDNVTMVASQQADTFLFQNGNAAGKTSETPSTHVTIHNFTVGEDSILLLSQGSNSSPVKSSAETIEDILKVNDAIKLDTTNLGTGELKIIIDWSKVDDATSWTGESLHTSSNTEITLVGVNNCSADTAVDDFFG